MRSRRHGLAFLFAALIGSAGAAAAPPAHAQGAPAEDVKEQAKQAYLEGKKKFETNDFAGALPHFQRADKLYPGAAPKHMIAVCLDNLGRSEEALTAYRNFVTSDPGDKYVDKVAAANKRISELEATVPATIKVTLNPPGVAGAKITVDGQPAAGNQLKLAAGAHTIVVEAGGYETLTETVTVRGAEQRELTLTLTPTAKVPPPPTEPPPTEPVDEGGSSNVPAYVTLGIAGAGAILGTVFGVQALGAKSDFDEMPTVDNADKAERAALIADMSFGVALTFGITGAVLLFSGGDDDEAEEEEAADSAKAESAKMPVVAPYVTPTGGGVAGQIRF